VACDCVEGWLDGAFSSGVVGRLVARGNLPSLSPSRRREVEQGIGVGRAGESDIMCGSADDRWIGRNFYVYPSFEQG